MKKGAREGSKQNKESKSLCFDPLNIFFDPLQTSMVK